MELKKYLKILKENFYLVILFVLAAATISLLASPKIASGYRQSKIFYVSSPKIEASQYYTYEGFYSQEKARNFTDTAVAILESVDFTSQILSPQENIQVTKVAPQVLRISATAPSQTSTNLVLEKITTAFNQKMLDLQGASQSFEIRPVGASQDIFYQGANRKIIIIFGALVGAIFALVVISLKTYFKL